MNKIMKKDPAVLMIIFSLGMALIMTSTALIRVNQIKNDYKEGYEMLQESQDIVVMQMDEGCAEQFKNNMDKTLYLKIRFEGKDGESYEE
jgi:hypothetical protein